MQLLYRIVYFTCDSGLEWHDMTSLIGTPQDLQMPGSGDDACSVGMPRFDLFGGGRGIM